MSATVLQMPVSSKDCHETMRVIIRDGFCQYWDEHPGMSLLEACNHYIEYAYQQFEEGYPTPTDLV